MEKTTLERFFAGKLLQIPPYQRDYAWGLSNVDDLWNDIQETFDLSTSHYLGTFILAKKSGDDVFDTVDGQQRLVTLTMLVAALIHKLDPSEDRQRIVMEERYLEDRGRKRLTLLGDNQAFFQDLLASKTPNPSTGGQKRMRAAFQHIRELVNELASRDPSAVGRWIDGIGRLHVLEFLEDNEGNAIRIFETVNDRGRPLAIIDKIKSYLIYASSRYLDGQFDTAIQERFGRVFRSFDVVKEIGRRIGVELIQRERFTEDSVLLYHFQAFPSDFHDYRFAAEDVLDLFLKPAIKNLVSNRRLDELRKFVDDYSEDCARFFEGLRSLMHRAETEPAYYKLFTSLPLSAQLYPLTIRLSAMDVLDKPLPTDPTRTFLDTIEAADIRVYKTRGTRPEKDVARLACEARSLPPAEIAARLADFVRRFMGDSDFKYNLGRSVYLVNEGTRHILLEFDESLRLNTTGAKATIDELKVLWSKEPTIDHILAQMPGFEPKSRGFKDDSDFFDRLHHLGNLTIVEKTINSASHNKMPEQKATEDRLYKNSMYPSTRQLAAGIAAATQVGHHFDAQRVEDRSKEVVDFSLGRWPLW